MGWNASRMAVLLAAAFCGLTGCSADTSRGTVSGTVTLDGLPLKAGLVRFIPGDGQSATADAVITDGEFAADVPIGKKLVWISAPKVVGQRKVYDTPDSPKVDVVEELLPPRYNAQSELTVTVKAGKQEASFELNSGR